MQLESEIKSDSWSWRLLPTSRLTPVDSVPLPPHDQRKYLMILDTEIAIFDWLFCKYTNLFCKYTNQFYRASSPGTSFTPQSEELQFEKYLFLHVRIYQTSTNCILPYLLETYSQASLRRLSMFLIKFKQICFSNSSISSSFNFTGSLKHVIPECFFASFPIARELAIVNRQKTDSQIATLLYCERC